MKGWIIPETITGHDLLCVKVNIPNEPAYRQAFWLHLKEYTDWWKWEQLGRGDTRASQVAKYLKPIMAENLAKALAGETCEDCETEFIMLRQNPSNPCQLQQSDDGGTTWTLAFDYSLCQRNNSVDELLVRQYQQDLTRQQLCGDASTEVIPKDGGFLSPSLGSDFTYDDHRWAGLCVTLRAVVETSLRIALDRANNVNAGINNATVALGVVAAVLATVGSGGALTPLILSLGAAGLSLANGLFQFNVTEASLDEDAKNEVICRASKILGEADSATLQDLKRAFGGEMTGTAEAIRALVFALLSADNANETFGAFVRGFDAETKLFAAGLGQGDCGCGEPCDLYIDETLEKSMPRNRIKFTRLSQNRYRLFIPRKMAGEVPAPSGGCDSLEPLRVVIRRRDGNNPRARFFVANIAPVPFFNLNDISYLSGSNLDAPLMPNTPFTGGAFPGGGFWGWSFCTILDRTMTYEFDAFADD